MQLASFPSYNLTTVAHPLVPMVTASVQMLISKIETRDVVPEHISIGGKLMVRGSTRRET
ncbi:hypothetical protein IB267_17310 [Ensifer sp. ENS09]|nr:hypothetical protein [Ensifer sp. ENS09]